MDLDESLLLLWIPYTVIEPQSSLRHLKQFETPSMII